MYSSTHYKLLRGCALKKVLLIEDDEQIVHLIERQLQSQKLRFQLMHTNTVEFARKLFENYQNSIMLIAVDGTLGGDGIDQASELVRYFRNNHYYGPILATSSSLENQRRLVSMGCDRGVEKIKISNEVSRLCA